MSSPLFLAIDQGGHASRAIVFDRAGTIVAQAEAAITTHSPKPGWVEHDAEALLRSIEQTLAEIGQLLGARLADIEAAGLATQRSSIACWDSTSGAALAPVLSWQDRRHQSWLEALAADASLIHQRTGLRLSPHYGASKMRWCLDHLPAVQGALDEERLAMGPLASYLAFNLLAERPLVADPANASRTLLWSLARRDWDDTLLALFRIPRAILPPCASSRGSFGTLTLRGHAIPVQIITGDQSAALFAWGEPSPNAAYINMGTGAFIQRPVSTPLLSETLLSSVAYIDETSRYYTLEGTVNGAARALHSLAREERIDALDSRLELWLDEIERPPLFLNGVAGLAAPYWRPDFSSRFIGEGGPEARAVAVAESIVFLIQRNLEEIEHDLPAADTLFVSGGLAGLSPLCQRLADLSGRPVQRPESVEATARGLAFLGADRPADWPVGHRDHFPPRHRPALQNRYLRWKAKLEMELSET